MATDKDQGKTSYINSATFAEGLMLDTKGSAAELVWSDVFPFFPPEKSVLFKQGKFLTPDIDNMFRYNVLFM